MLRKITSFIAAGLLCAGLIFFEKFLWDKLANPVPGETFEPSSPEPTLTASGIILWTNRYRAQNGRAPLIEDSQLDLIAGLRAQDMFLRQYFAHIAPDGTSPETVADTLHYSYTKLGENIALGDFTDDADIVTEWMRSPEHRDSILLPAFTKIGVAIRKGVLKGQTVWIGVQVFASPPPDCPVPDPALKAKIDAMNAQIDTWKKSMQTLQAQMDDARFSNTTLYGRLATRYNELVSQINAMIDRLEDPAATYQAQVNTQKKCMEHPTTAGY
jgi:hypothetical protein